MFRIPAWEIIDNASTGESHTSPAQRFGSEATFGSAVNHTPCLEDLASPDKGRFTALFYNLASL